MSWLLKSSDLSTSYSYECNYTIFVQALFYNSISCAAPPLTDTNTVDRRLQVLSKACYVLGAVAFVICMGLQRRWFPPPRIVVAAIECHGEIPQVEARMSDADLSRPLALCSLNFALAEITVTDASGAATMIPGTSEESSIIYEVHTPVELEEHEVRLTKQPYDPYPELRTCATYIVQTKVSPGAISAAKLQARTEEGFKPRCVEVEMVDYALPYEVSIEAALRKDGAAVQAIPNASRPKSRDSRESVTRNLSDAQNDTTWTTGGHIQDPPPHPLQMHVAQAPHVEPVCSGMATCSTAHAMERLGHSSGADEDTNLIHLDVDFRR